MGGPLKNIELLKKDKKLKKSVMDKVSETAKWFKQDQDINDFCDRWNKMKTEIERERILWIGEIAKLKNKLNDTSKSLIGSEALINYFNVMKHDAFKIDQLFYDYKIGLYDPQKQAARIEEICSKNYNIMPFQICVKSVFKSLKELSEISKNILIARVWFKRGHKKNKIVQLKK